MAQFEITMDEYRRWNHSPKRSPWKRNVLWAASLAALVVSLIAGQYAFSIVWAALLSFAYFVFYRSMPRMQLNHMTNNPYARGPFDIEFRVDGYTVRVGDSALDLSVDDLGRVHEFEEYYTLNHKSSVTVQVPKRALSDDELGIVEAYQKDHPGLPENTSIPDY